MKNSVKDIGKKIKALRIEKNLTQSELCGTMITRNHLSIIESGKSLPSLSTLCYIAERLDIPAGYFFSEDEQEEAKFANLFTIDDAKQAFVSQNYSKCVQICEEIPSSLQGDEMSQLIGESHFALSLSAAEKLDIRSAKKHLKSAANAAERSCYLSEKFNNAVSYYELLLSSLTKKDIPQRLTDIHEASSYVHAELILYLKMLTQNDYDFFISVFSSAFHREHAEALKAKHESDIHCAFAILKSLSEDNSLPYYMKYYVYDDLEQCADTIGEFRTAYSAAKLKIEIMNK